MNQDDKGNRGTGGCAAAFASLLLLALATTACARVDAIRLTSETFPPKDSADDVEVLDHHPTRPYIEIADLSIADTGLSLESMQGKMLKKAASLGADAVVFSTPESHVNHEVAYEPVYSPWGYYGPYYGPGSWGYGGALPGGWGYGGPYGPWGYGPWGMGGGAYAGSVAVPYDVTVHSLKGTAIKYQKTEDHHEGRERRVQRLFVLWSWANAGPARAKSYRARRA